MPAKAPSRPPLRKALGQHHLVDGGLCRPLISFLAPEGERVMEVGPGGGVLTGELLAAGASRVVGWELDLAWAATLGRRLPEPRLSLVIGDALEIEWGRLPAPTLAAGNLPYNVATAILERLLPHYRTVPRAAFLVQKEVADRLAARPGDAAYGSLSVLVAAWSHRAESVALRPPGHARAPRGGAVKGSPPPRLILDSAQ